MNITITPNDIAALAQKVRKELPMTQQELADAVGVSRDWVMTFEKNPGPASFDLVLKVCRKLNIALEISSDNLVFHPLTQNIVQKTLRGKRQEMKMSQEKLAEEIGQSASWVSSLETGKWLGQSIQGVLLALQSTNLSVRFVAPPTSNNNHPFSFSPAKKVTP